MDVGETGQIHLFGGEQPSPLAKGADQGPASPHLALSVADILEAKPSSIVAERLIGR
jgi:hypothetical protein